MVMAQVVAAAVIAAVEELEGDQAQEEAVPFSIPVSPMSLVLMAPTLGPDILISRFCRRCYRVLPTSMSEVTARVN